MIGNGGLPVTFFITISLLLSCRAFQSDELLVDDEEFGIESGLSHGSLVRSHLPSSISSNAAQKRSSNAESDSKIQFSLEHAFGDSEFSPAGTFSARIKTLHNSGQTLTKLRFSRNIFTDTEKDQFKKLLEDDDFYRIRLLSSVFSPPGRNFVISSVKARCLAREGLEEHFTIHTEGVNILAVNYGSPGACHYPRQLKLPAKWSFNSITILKNSEQAPRTPLFAEVIPGEVNVEGIKPPERSFWAKYWMYLIPLGLIVMNTLTQAMNMAEEQTAGQGQQSTAAIQRAQNPAIRRR